MDTRAYMPQSKSTEYETPHDLFDQLDKEFGPFTLDPCGQREHHYSAFKCVNNGGHFYDGSTEAMDGLLQPWKAERVFMNPVYGRGMPAWIDKAVAEVLAGNAGRVVALIPARTDTRIWQRHILQGAAVDRMDAPYYVRLVRFLAGRVRFGGAPASAPFPSAIIVWELPHVTSV